MPLGYGKIGPRARGLTGVLGKGMGQTRGKVDVLRTLMEAHDLLQKDLVPIFGSESIVSEILHKKRDLNKAHIEKLSKRFAVSPAVFFPGSE
jgi:antitoxin component HigA of HigAB toxin-antitoxin module